MPACLADAEPETGHHLLAGKPYPPTPPCFPFPLPESPRPRETTEVETGGGNRNASALRCKLQPETRLSYSHLALAQGKWGEGGRQRTGSRLLHEQPQCLINRVPGAVGSAKAGRILALHPWHQGESQGLKGKPGPRNLFGLIVLKSLIYPELGGPHGGELGGVGGGYRVESDQPHAENSCHQPGPWESWT